MYIQYCGVYIQYCNASICTVNSTIDTLLGHPFSNLPKPVIFNTNQEILYLQIYLINPSYMKEKKSIIDLHNTVSMKTYVTIQGCVIWRMR